MKLLIIGAGGHGRVVAEIARDCGYDEIAFLDDNCPDALGTTADLEKFAPEYPDAFVGIGDGKLRAQLLDRLEAAGCHIPTLIHPAAYVSPSAVIGRGTVVEPKAAINANTHIGRGCIVQLGSIVDHNVEIDSYVNVNTGAIVKAGARLLAFRKLEAGEVVLGYEQAIVH